MGKLELIKIALLGSSSSLTVAKNKAGFYCPFDVLPYSYKVPSTIPFQ